jgi:predicted transposase/invertase (TIGR01784 family)
VLPSSDRRQFMKKQIEITDQTQEKTGKSYTFRPLSELNVIDNFLFTTLLTREGSKEKVARLILSSILDKEFRNVTVTAQREFPGIDTDRHGIRLDVSIMDDDDEATVYDLEPDNNSKDKESLPKRNRFYSSVIDSANLSSGKPYEKLPALVIIMILSYDPFGAGDLYYEAGTQLKTHPNIPYEDGIRRIYLYADGNCNLAGAAGEKMKSMVRYIRYSDKEHVVDEATAELDTIVREARANEEVSMVYLRTLEREEELKEEGREEGFEKGRNIRDQEKIEEMLRRGKKPKEIADFCGYPMELIRKVEKGIS